MRIADLRPGDEETAHTLATLLVKSFREHWPNAYPDLESARAEVYDSLAVDRISRVAMGNDGQVLGWIGGIPQYGGLAWELHPLVVREDCRRRGIARGLVEDLERQVAARGGITLWVGSDDEDNLTSLGGVDLYPNVLDRLASLKNLRDHPIGFYQRVGFTVVGVLPDANGFGKPDIFLAKRVKGAARLPS